jgi:hypothetical protein
VAANPFAESTPIAEASSPFADSMPFGDAAAAPADYENAEEVSLEQLLAGRERPATFSGNVAVPQVEEVEELGAEALVAAPDDVAVAVLDEPVPVDPMAAQPMADQPMAEQPNVVYADTRVAELEAQVRALETKLAIRRNALESILRELDELRARVNEQLDL